MPWILTQSDLPTRRRRPVGRPPEQEYSVVDAVHARATIEKDRALDRDAGSSAAAVASRRIALRAGEPGEPVRRVGGRDAVEPARGSTALCFDGRASAPMRVSVQLRFDELRRQSMGTIRLPRAEAREGSRAIDQTVAGRWSGSPPPTFASASSILFVVDLTNASPGQSGRFDIEISLVLALA